MVDCSFIDDLALIVYGSRQVVDMRGDPDDSLSS